MNVLIIFAIIISIVCISFLLLKSNEPYRYNILKDIGDFWGNHYIKLTDFIDRHKYSGHRYYDKIRRAIGQDNLEE